MALAKHLGRLPLQMSSPNIKGHNNDKYSMTNRDRHFPQTKLQTNLPGEGGGRRQQRDGGGGLFEQFHGVRPLLHLLH